MARPRWRRVPAGGLDYGLACRPAGAVLVVGGALFASCNRPLGARLDERRSRMRRRARLPWPSHLLWNVVGLILLAVGISMITGEVRMATRRG